MGSLSSGDKEQGAEGLTMKDRMKIYKKNIRKASEVGLCHFTARGDSYFNRLTWTKSMLLKAHSSIPFPRWTERPGDKVENVIFSKH